MQSDDMASGGAGFGLTPATPIGSGIRGTIRDMFTPRDASIPEVERTGDITPTSVMGSLLESGLLESLASTSQQDSPVMHQIMTTLRESGNTDTVGALAKEIALATSTRITKAASRMGTSGLGTSSPALTGLPKAIYQMASSVHQDTVNDNPLLQTMEVAKSDDVDLKLETDKLGAELTVAKMRHTNAGDQLGLRQSLEEELAMIADRPPDDLELIDVKTNISKLEDMTILTKNLRGASEFLAYREECLWQALVPQNVRYDKSNVKMMELPDSINPEDRKQVLRAILAWTTQPAIVKQYPLLIPEIRAMVTVMDPRTGKYQKPRKAKDMPVRIRHSFIEQEKSLSSKLLNETTNIEYTTLWDGSANIGTSDYVELYTVDPRPGLDKLFVWISQYVLIEVGTSRLDIMLSLNGIAELYKAPTPMETNAPIIRELLTTCVQSGVTPEWLPIGVNCIRAVANRGQAYTNAIDSHGLKEGCEYSISPKSHDITRMLLDLIAIVKSVDNKERFMESEDSQAKQSKKKDKTSAMQVDAEGEQNSPKLSAKLKRKLATSDWDAIDVPDTTRKKVHAMLLEKHPQINLESKKHDGKLVAADILLNAGQKLSMWQINKAAPWVGSQSTKGGKGSKSKGGKSKGKGKGRSKGKGQDDEKACDGKGCRSKCASWQKYCKYHFDLTKEGKTVQRKDGKTESTASSSTMSITVADESNNVTTYQVDSETVSLLKRLKDQGHSSITEAEAVGLKQTNTQAMVATLIQQ